MLQIISALDTEQRTFIELATDIGPPGHPVAVNWPAIPEAELPRTIPTTGRP